MDNKITVNDILKVCNATLILGNKEVAITTYSSDTRTLNTGDMYLALSEEGNRHIAEAFEKGAIGCITGQDVPSEVINSYKDKIIIKVYDIIKAIQLMAEYKRQLYDIPVIAVTGSVGKTSTKDIIASVLSKKYNVLKTEGNYNNHIGVPLTLLRLQNETAVVVEMGMNHFGEISVLSKIAKPTMAVITNIGTAHIGILGSKENILKAKLEILEGMKENSELVINNDDELLSKIKYNNLCTYGINNISEYTAYNVNGRNYKIDINDVTYDVEVPVLGSHFIYNSLCAIAVGRKLNIEMDKILEGIKEFKLTSKRMEIEEINKITFIKDYYNASYDSMKPAIEVLSQIKAERKIAVLGDMLELGDFTQELHEKVGEEIAKNHIDILITVGEFAQYIAQKAKSLGTKEVYICENNNKAVDILKDILKSNDAVLFKASNRMNFGEILTKIQ